MTPLSRGIISSGKLGVVVPEIFTTNDADFNGSTDYFSHASETEFQIPTDLLFSFEYSVYMHSIGGVNVRVMSKYDTSGSDWEWLVGFNSTNASLHVVDVDGGFIFTTTFAGYTFLINTQYHIVITSDAINARLYVNGALEVTKPRNSIKDPRQSTSVFAIGA